MMNGDEIKFIIGGLVLGNLGTIGLVLRGVWFLAKAHSRLEHVEKDLNALFEKHRSKTDTQGDS